MKWGKFLLSTVLVEVRYCTSSNGTTIQVVQLNFCSASCFCILRHKWSIKNFKDDVRELKCNLASFMRSSQISWSLLRHMTYMSFNYWSENKSRSFVVLLRPCWYSKNPRRPSHWVTIWLKLSWIASNSVNNHYKHFSTLWQCCKTFNI